MDHQSSLLIAVRVLTKLYKSFLKPNNTSAFSLPSRVLCETVKDFVAKVGKAYEKSAENAEECDSMSLKVRHKKYDYHRASSSAKIQLTLRYIKLPVPEHSV